MLKFNEDEFLENFQKKETQQKAFTSLIKEYQERLYWHIRKIVIVHDDTDDVLQNTFVKIWKGLSKFRYDSKLYTWMYKIATNEAITFITDKRKKLSMLGENIDNYLNNAIENSMYIDGDEIKKKLQKAILLLPEKQRIVFNMKYFDNMKYDDMAEILETSVGALKASYHHAKNKIEEIILTDK